MGLIKDIYSLTRDSVAIAAKKKSATLQTWLTDIRPRHSGSGSTMPAINFRLNSLIEREDANLATCVRIIGNAIAWLPLRVMEVDRDEKGNEIFVSAPDHPFHDLWKEPNNFHTTSDMHTHLVHSSLCTGNGYLSIESDRMALGRGNTAPGELRPLNAWEMQLKTDKQKWPERYVQRPGQEDQRFFELDELVHVRLYNINDPLYGRSPVEPLNRTLWTEYQAEMMQLSFFVNDGTPRKALMPDNDVTPTQQEQIEEFYKARANPDDKHRLQIMPVAGKFQDITPSMSDMEFEKMRRFHRERTFGLIGIPPFLGGVMEYANFANALIQEASFWRHSAIPFTKLIADFLTRQLLWRHYDRDHVLQHDLSDVKALQMDEVKKATKGKILVAGGIWTPNEVRQIDYAMEPLEGGDKLVKPKTVGQAPPPGDGSVGSGAPDKTHLVEIRTWRDNKIVDTKAVDHAKFVERWKAFDEQATKYEPVIQKGLKKFWAGQLKRVLAALHDKTLDGTMMSHLVFQAKGGHGDFFMDWAGEDAQLEALFHPIMLEIAQGIGDDALVEIRQASPTGVSVEFDVDNPKVKLVIEQFARKITRINNTTQKEVRRILKVGFDQRLSINDVAKLLTKKFREFNTVRSKMIARTEMTGIANSAETLAWEQNGATGKTWIATGDDRTRDYHSQAGYDGERVGIKDYFMGGPEPMSGPGDPAATLGANVINCRCTLGYDYEPIPEAVNA